MTSSLEHNPNRAKKPMFKVTVTTVEINKEDTTLLKKKRRKGKETKDEGEKEEGKPSKIRQSDYVCVYSKPPLSIDKEALRLRYKYSYGDKYYQIIDDVLYFMISSNGLIITMSFLNFITVWSGIEPYEKKGILFSNPMIKFICEVSNKRLIGYSILKEIFIWSIESFKLISTIQTTQAIDYFKMINDGRLLMHSPQFIFIWNFNYNEPQLEYTFDVNYHIKNQYIISQIKSNEIIFCSDWNIIVYSYITNSQVKKISVSNTPIAEIIKSKYLDLCAFYSKTTIGVIDSQYEMKSIELIVNHSLREEPRIVNMIEMKQGMFAVISSIGELSLIEVSDVFQVVSTFILWREELTLLNCLDDGRLVILRNKEQMICTFNHELPRSYTNKWINIYINRKQVMQLPNEKIVFLRANKLNILE